MADIARRRHARHALGLGLPVIHWIRALLCSGLVLVANAALADGASSGVGPVWAVDGVRDTTVYLAGSVHVLRPEDNELPSGFELAYADAEALVMELDLDEVDPARIQSYMLENSLLDPTTSLRELYGPKRYEKVEAGAARMGLPLAGLQQLKPWAVALMLAQLELARMGLDPEQGVEQQLAKRARADDKPLGGLETLAEQLDVLNDLSVSDQAKFLELSIEEAETGSLPESVDTLIGAWRRGDTELLSKLLLDEYARFPSLYRPLVEERNRRWLPQVERLLKADQDTMVVVGALHLVGDDGLLKLLEARGYKARRVSR